MADLKPLGSERLTGKDKLKRIMEIARYNEATPNNLNETSKTEYSIPLADGNQYQIVKEKQGYVIKKTITESETDYIEPMKNRKYYSSYSQALKRLNLLAKEINRLNENEEGVQLFGEQKKFVLKTPKPEVDAEMPSPAPVEPPVVPSPELPASPELGSDMGSEEQSPEVDSSTEMDTEISTPDGEVDMEMDSETIGDAPSDEMVTFKTIQKLTGKLTQKIRTLDNKEGMTSEDIKYVINMVLSSLDLSSLTEEDREDILSKFEEAEGREETDMELSPEEDMTSDTEVEDIQSDMDVPVDQEMGEGKIFGSFGDEHGWYDEKDFAHKGDFDFDYDEEEFDEFEPMYQKYGDKTRWFAPGEEGKNFFNTYKEKFGPMKIRRRREENEGHGTILDNIFSESKVDKVLSKYFEYTKKEILEHKERKVRREKESKTIVEQKMKDVVKFTETIEQELASKKFLEENVKFNLVGKTNKKNLVFENSEKQVKITPEGMVI